jgi:tetratricopeptide (TPR) repeat protein
MAKIPLRSYNHDIEKLIDQGQFEEAIAHCRFIFQTFPKHLETYRLLGKSYLENERYGEAADIFLRVLSSAPDDFVSNIGMSIIREDEGNLDSAIWHMERAYEVQPSNAAVQGELRRLYGRRDGLEPTRIRLTRGALARMYVRGDLYHQAVAEARAGLSEEPQRPDLQILLARMCYVLGQRVEATELCSTLLTRFPYCYEANMILAEILPGTKRAADAQIYRMRINALDPYAAFTSTEMPDVSDVPETAVMIDRLDWQPSAPVTEQPQWATTLGINVFDRGKNPISSC